MLWISTLFQLGIVFAHPTSLSPREPTINAGSTVLENRAPVTPTLLEDTSINPQHGILQPRDENQARQCATGERLRGSYCRTLYRMATQCAPNAGGPERTQYADCPAHQFCMRQFYSYPLSAECVPETATVHWQSSNALDTDQEACQGVNSQKYLGKQVRMHMVFLKGGDSYVPVQVGLYDGSKAIQHVGPADMYDGTFVSRPFLLRGGVKACVEVGSEGVNIYAIIAYWSG